MLKNLSNLAKKYDTPLYVYDADTIHSQYNTLNSAFEKIPFKIKYAAKALSNINILSLLKKWGCGLDAVSINEIKLGLIAGFSPNDIIYTPSSVSFDEIKTAYKLGVILNIDSLSILKKFAIHHKKATCSLRFNPGITAGGNPKIQTGHEESKFGISKENIQKVLEIVNKNEIKVIGLHIHTGSDILCNSAFLKTANVLYDLAKYFPFLEFLDMGSGLKVSYKDDDSYTNIEKLAQELIPSFEMFCKKYGKNIELWLEPGKYLVSSAGYLLVTVNQIKKNDNIKFVGVNSGFNHLIRPMLYDAYHKIINLTNPNGTIQKYDIVGYICEEDTFARGREISTISEGDVLCFFNAGAYGYSMSSNYNSRFRPAEVLMQQEKDYLIRKRETFEDLVNKQDLLL